MHGARRSERPRENLEAVRWLLEAVQVLALDRLAAERFGELKALLESRGTPLPDMDLLVASIVLVHDGTLVTHDGRLFRRIGGLALEDWL